MANRQLARLVLIIAILEIVSPIIAGIGFCCQDHAQGKHSPIVAATP
jgi:hypothetical protein